MAVGAADIGLGIEAAAQAFSLVFRPLVKEDHYLVCLKEALNAPPVQASRSPSALPARAQAPQALRSYGVQQPGQVLSRKRAAVVDLPHRQGVGVTRA